MDALLMDLKYATRSLRQRPFFSAIIILTLALGIGSNAAIFSVVNGFLIRPLPFQNSDRLMALTETRSNEKSNGSVQSGQYEVFGVSYLDFLDWRQQGSSFKEISLFIPQSVNLTGTGRPDRVRGGFVSANFFTLLKSDPLVGRSFTKNEDQPGTRVVLLQEETWKNRFASDPQILGKKLILNGEPFTVIGIMPAQFQFPMDELEIWLPVSSYPAFSQMTRSDRSFFCLGRLADGFSLNQAQSEMIGIAQKLSKQYPDSNTGIGIQLEPFHEVIVKYARPALLILMGAVGFILLIACANIANLLLSTGLARQKELGIKAAIGASRFRLVRQMLMESMLLGAMGGTFGLLVASWGVDVLVALGAQQIPRGFHVGIDARVVAFAFLLSVSTVIIFGLVPALQLSDIRLLDFIGRAGQAISKGQGKTSKILVVSQIALSLMLLIGSGLLIKSFWQLTHVSPGIRPQNLLSMEYRLPRNKYPEQNQQLNFHNQVLENISSIRGVESVAITRGLPFSGNGGSTEFILPDNKVPARGNEPRALMNTVSANYFQTIGIPLLRGRKFDSRDHLNSSPVVVVNQKFANQFWPSQDPIGKQIHFIEEDITATVIGVVGNAKQFSLDEEFQPQIYLSLSQNPGFFATVVARTSVDPMTLAEEMKKAVWRVDSDQPMWKVRTVEFLLERDVSARRFVLLLLVSFAVLALALTLIGLYGVVSHFVRRRTRDIGIRMALGAQRSDILTMVLRQGVVLSAIGAIVGLAGSMALTRILTNLLYQVRPSDPIAVVAGIVFLSAATLCASLIPAYRATRIHPIAALRYE
jgi:putative ABC transport system permease protein